MLRIFLAILALLTAFVAAIAAAAIGEMAYPGLVASLACLVAGFLSLRLARRPQARAAPMRMTLSVCCLITIGMLAGLSWPPARTDLATWAVLLGSIALAVASVITHRDHPRAAVLLLTLPAINSLWTLLRIVRSIRASGGAEVLGPSVTLAFFVAAVGAVGWVVAPWHAWTAGRSG